MLLAVGGGIGGAVAYFFSQRPRNGALCPDHLSLYDVLPHPRRLLHRRLGQTSRNGHGRRHPPHRSRYSPRSRRRRRSGQGQPKAAWTRWLGLLGVAFLLTGIPQVSQAAAARLGAINLWFYLFLTFSAGAAALWLFILLKGTMPGRGVLSYGALAAVGSVAGNFFTLKALGKLPEPVVFPVSLAGPVIAAVLLSLLYFKERIEPLGYLGILAGLAGIVASRPDLDQGRGRRARGPGVDSPQIRRII
ncbi:MAG: DMT family transporter [Ignavibacteriales bacterium]|nr:DMT family transporter [Ignavibacteriales bacterium]